MSPTPSRELRIGIDGRELEGKSTGVGRYVRSLLRRFALQDRHHFIIYSASPVALPVASPRIETRVLPGGPALIWEQRTLPGFLRADRIDVLLSPAYSCPLTGSVPRVTAIHDLSFFARREEFGFLHGLRRRTLARLSARVSQRVLACSVFTKTEIRRHLGEAAAAKTEVVLLGPDDDLPPGPGREASRAALGLDEGAPYVVTVGTMLRRRNVGMLVRAMARLREKHPGARLAIVGENRSHPFEDVALLAASLGCGDAVLVSGFVSDEAVACHYAAADAAVFLSEYEGFGLPTLEAMSRGVPTIIANRGSLNELFSGGALVVEPEEMPVADALSRILSDSVTRADLREKGRERARTFSWERAAAETLSVLERAAG